MRVPTPLEPLVDYGVIQEVIRPLMSGKEADVYIVSSEGETRVAKVYKDAQNRSFRQRSDYAEGRQVRNSRSMRAMSKGSRFGKEMLEASWQNSEVDALYRLHDAGVRVPIPYHYSDNVLVMELVEGPEGGPAPRLVDYDLNDAKAIRVHQIVTRQVVQMLCAGLVHGDLSEYNILVSGEGPVIIDFPQATNAANNRNSERIFLRDMRNLRNYLGKWTPQLKKTRFGPEIWALYQTGNLMPDSHLTGKRKRRNRSADTSAIVAEIQAAAQEESDRPMSAYQKKKLKAREAAASTQENKADGRGNHRNNRRRRGRRGGRSASGES